MPSAFQSSTGSTGAAGATGATGPTGSGPSYLVLTSDLAARPNTTLTNTTGLAFTAATGGYYQFSFGVVFQSAVTTTGIKLGITFPAATVFAAVVNNPVSTATDGVTSIFRGFITSSGDAVIGTGVQAINTNYMAQIDGVILPSTGGTVQVQHASGVTGSNVTIKQASWGLVNKVG